MLLLPYAKDVAQRQQSFAAAVAELTGQVKVKFQQQLPPLQLSPYSPLPSLSAYLCITSSAKRQTNALAARGLEPISQSHFQVAAALLFPLLPLPLSLCLLRSAGRVASSFGPRQICYANGKRFNYRARQLKYRHMKHKLKRI